MKQYLFMSELLCFFHLISMSNFLLLYSVWNKTELQIIYLATINKYLTIYSCTCISWSSTSTRSIVQIDLYEIFIAKRIKLLLDNMSAPFRLWTNVVLLFFSQFPNLRVLDLSCNYIERIENLDQSRVSL